MATLGRDTTITWIGHGTFAITTPGGKRILIDPWLDDSGNPAAQPATAARLREQPLDAIFITHAHGDHVGSAVTLAKATGAQVVCQFDLVPWFASQGIAEGQLVGFNKGGTVTVAGIQATMTAAQHSSSTGGPGGNIMIGTEAGYVLRMENGFTIYHTGDTAVTMDMQIIGDLYAPDVTILPIGDHFTMGPRQAAYALKLTRSRYAIPEHFGTFGLLTGTPEQLREHLAEFGVSCEVIALKPGESVE